MSALRSLAIPREWGDQLHNARILLFGGSSRTLDLLRIAVIRSDNVLLVGAIDGRSRHFAESFAVEMRESAEDIDIERAATILVAIGDQAAENALVRQARAAGIPVHVAGRPLVSDFNLLEFLEWRSRTTKRV